MNDAQVCKRNEVMIDGKCINTKLSKTEIDDVLNKVKKYLKKGNMLYVGVDIPLYKENKGFIDFTTDKRWFEVIYRKH